ncbi:hypothetical protein TNCV_415571 [Trichonephila clavipes]|nr:hypothetical protein TNCV_415571 [Trichonephila clavipes]
MAVATPLVLLVHHEDNAGIELSGLPELLSIQRTRTFKRYRQAMTENFLMVVSFTEYDHQLPVRIGISLCNRHELVEAAEVFC